MKRLWNSVTLAVLLFILVPLDARAGELLIPVGKVIGLQLSDSTVTVAAFDDVLGTAAREAGLRIGDEIVTVGGQQIGCAEDIRLALSSCGSPVELTVRRSDPHTAYVSQ